MLCLTGFILVWQSALSDWFYISVAECSVWGVFYYCGRVLCLGGILLLWQSALSGAYFNSVADYISRCGAFSLNSQRVSFLQAYLLLDLISSTLLAGTGGKCPLVFSVTHVAV